MSLWTQILAGLPWRRGATNEASCAENAGSTRRRGGGPASGAGLRSRGSCSLEVASSGDDSLTTNNPKK